MDEDRDEPTHIDLEVNLDELEDGKSGEEENEDDDNEEEEEKDESQAEAEIKEETTLIDGDHDAGPQIYSDGTYTANGSYQSPAGPESISITLTIEGDVVTSVTTTPHSENDTSLNYQNNFASGVSASITGLALNQLNVGTISGASLTTKGFQTAVANIQTQAS